MKLTKILLTVVALLSFVSFGATQQVAPKTHLLYDRLTPEVVRVQERDTFNQRKNIAKKIELRFRKRGITDNRAIVAAWVNSWHESRWNRNARGGNCKGIFQLLTRRPDRWLYNADRNIDILLNESPFKQRIDKWNKWVKDHPRASVSAVTLKFASEVERCAPRHRAMRGATAARWWKVIYS